MNNFWFTPYYEGLQALEGEPAFTQWCEQLPSLIQQAYSNSRHGNLEKWQKMLQLLPAGEIEKCELNRKAITVGLGQPYTGDETDTVVERLKIFKPWRKGPFDINGVYIDSEWRSDLKWDRLQSEVAGLENRLVLDVGCGNGYHCWRMAGAGARAVFGIDPMLLYVMQYYVIQHFIRADNVFVLPFGIEALPQNMQAFDTVFSMGVLYHRRSPLLHLIDLRNCLRSGGELVLETLVIEGGVNELLVPADRYAYMKNVWFIPSCEMLTVWLQRCGFNDIKLIDVTPTTVEEQRTTAWSGTASLVDFLDPKHPSLTVEGHPAPLRATFLAKI